MKRRYFIAGLAGLTACARDPRPRLNVYNWSAYIAPETIPNFEAEFGVRVRYATYESNEEMLAKVISGNSGWDVVFPTHTRLEPMRAKGLLAPLRHEWLTGLTNLDPRFQIFDVPGLFHSPEHQYAVIQDPKYRDHLETMFLELTAATSGQIR